MVAKKGFMSLSAQVNEFIKEGLAFLRRYKNVKFPSKKIKNYVRELPLADREQYEEKKF